MNALPAPRWWLALGLALVVAIFHFVNGQALAHSVLMQSFNWVFDFDSSRFVEGWCTPGVSLDASFPTSFASRHLLSITTRPLCLGLNLWFRDPGLSLVALTALCAGATAAIAYALASCFCASEIDRLLLALAYALSVQPLMMGVIPETYGFALAGIGLHFFLLARQQPHALGATPAGLASAVVNAGVTVTNGALNLVSSVVMSWQRTSLRRWLGVEIKTWAWTALLLVVLVLPLLLIFDSHLLSKAGNAPKEIWWVVNINRGEPASLLMVICTFFLYSFVAPAFTIVDLPDDGHTMLDFRAFQFGLPGAAALLLWSLGMVAGVYWAWRRDALRRLLLVVAIWMLLNIILHWFWQYRGSVYLYGTHSCFALFAALAMGYGCALQEGRTVWARAWLVALIVLTGWNNLPRYAEMIDFMVRQPLAAG